MLKSMGMHKLVIPVIALMLATGVILTGLGFAMEGNVDYLKEKGSHKWYQVVYIDDSGWLRVGISFGDFGIFGNIGASRAPQAPSAPAAPSLPDWD